MADESAKSVENSELPKDVLAPAEGPRENLVATAVKFLQNPKVRQSPMYQKEAFLEKKGLTKEEIQLAVQRAGVSTDDSPPVQQLQPPLPQLQHPAVYANNGLVPAQHYMAPAPPPPVSLWMRAKDIATTTAIVAAASYAVYSLFKTYIRPWLMGKSQTEARMERLEKNVTQLQASIAESNTQMLEILRGIQETLASNRDRNTQQDGRTVSEIKAEISSLKGLLLNRRQFPPPPVTSPVIPPWQKTTLREDRSEPSAAQLTTGTGQPGSVDGTSEHTGQPDIHSDDFAAQASAAETSSLPEKDSSQTLDASKDLSSLTPADTVLASYSESSNTSSPNSFEVVRPNSLDSGDS